MLTAKENLRQTIIDGGHPDRFVNNYEGIYLMFHPQLIHSGGLLQPGDMNVVDAWGVTNSFPVGTPGAFPVHTPEKLVVKDIEDWKEYVKAPPTEFPEAEWEVFQQQYEDVKAADKAYCAAFTAPGIFEQSHHLCAIDNALMYFITNPEEMKDLIKYLTEYELRVAENVCDHLHPNALFHHDDWGSEINSFLRPEMFAEFFVDSYKEIYGYYKSRGAEFVFHHNDSYGANLIPYMIEMGIDVWQGTMESNNVKELLEEYKGKIAFMGNIDNKDVDFAGWTVEDVKRVAREHLEGYEFPSYIPCITQGGPGSTMSGTYVELVKAIDELNCEMFGFTQQEIDDARMPLQVMFG